MRCGRGSRLSANSHYLRVPRAADLFTREHTYRDNTLECGLSFENAQCVPMWMYAQRVPRECNAPYSHPVHVPAELRADMTDMVEWAREILSEDPDQQSRDLALACLLALDETTSRVL